MSNVNEKFKIGQVARQLEISTRTIRYYEEVGLMGDNRVESGSIRFYSKAEILRLRFILKLKELGITLKEMKKIAVNYELNNQATDKILPQLIDILDSNLKGIEVKIDNLTALRTDINGYRRRIIDLLQQPEMDKSQVVNECPAA